MTYKIELQSVDRLTHDVRRLTFEKPAGYDYAPGQATDFALDRDGPQMVICGRAVIAHQFVNGRYKRGREEGLMRG